MLHSVSTTFWLDGQSSPIHAVNELESLQLVEGAVLDYVRFFLFAMRGDQGAFVLIEQADDITDRAASDDVKKLDPDSPLVAARAQWTPLRLDGRTDDGRFRVRATVAYAGALYASVFAVKPDGEIEMIDDQPLTALDGLAVPAGVELQREPEDSEPSASRTKSVVATQWPRSNGPNGRGRKARGQGTQRPAGDRSFVSVLLAEAVRRRSVTGFSSASTRSRTQPVRSGNCRDSSPSSRLSW